jgi:hypothetical protein
VLQADRIGPASVIRRNDVEALHDERVQDAQLDRPIGGRGRRIDHF